MKKENMLVVEDEDIMRESLVDWFASEDHTVAAAGDVHVRAATSGRSVGLRGRARVPGNGLGAARPTGTCR